MDPIVLDSDKSAKSSRDVDVEDPKSLENGELSQPSTKKKNRRKERSRKKKLTSLDNQADDISGQVELLSLQDSLLSSNGPNTSFTAFTPFTPTISAENPLVNIAGLESSVSSTSKKRSKKKKNVALASIKKLSECNGELKEISSPGISEFLPETSEIPPVIPTDTVKVNPRNRRRAKPVSEYSSDFNHESITNVCDRKSSSNRKAKPQAMKPKPQHFENFPNSSQVRQKQGGTGSRSRTNRSSESMLNENKFDDHFQRELVEAMMKNQANVVKGFIRINQRNFREAYINNPDGSRDIIIDGVKDRNRALEGDEVAVLILPESQWKNTDGIQKVGKVIYILTQVHHRQAVGSLKKMQDNNSRVALFSPRDSRVPRLQIPMKECPGNPKDWENCLFNARIVEWNDVRYAKGQLIGDSFGVQGDIEAETRAILLENEIDGAPYDRSYQVFFPEPPFVPTENDFKGREDLRKLCIFTIDPSTAKDLDDAVSCEQLDNGNFKVGVHISDVTYFLREGTPLDREVAKRATTTYLVQRAYHMLPRELTMMCSLLPGEDKLAFSVFWEMTPDAEVVSHYFTRSVINSCSQLAYEHAQVMIDDPNYQWKEGEFPPIYGPWTVEDLKKVVLSLQSLAAIMRKHRFDTGALRVDQTKLMFHLDSAGEPENFAAYINKESHRLIEEFMLLANMTVATALQSRFPKLSFLRCHDEPQPDMLKKLADTLEKFGIVLDISSAGSLHSSLQRCKSDSNDTRFLALNSLCSRPMVRARYFCAASIDDVQYMKHYALNAPLYTHFTSPIRRYADVMVHRLLSALLGYSDELKWSVDYVNSIAANCNKMKFCAKKAGEQSNELFLALWVRKYGSIVEEAVVLDVKDRSFDALICSTGSNIRVYTDKLSASVEFKNDFVPQLSIVWSIDGTSQHSTQIVTMFSVVRVALRVSNTNLLKLEASLLPPIEQN